MFVLSFKNGSNDPRRNPFDTYYMPLVAKLLLRSLTPNHFFEQPVKTKQDAYEKLVEMARNINYTTGNLLDYLYHQNYYKVIGIDLSRQTNTSILQQINFTGKSKEGDVVTFFLSLKSSKKLF